MPVFGEDEGGGGGAVEVRVEDDDDDGIGGEAVDVECVVVGEVVDDFVAAPDAPDFMSLVIPARTEVSEAGKPVVLDCVPVPCAADLISLTISARAAVTEAGNTVVPDGSSTCVSGQELSLFA